MMSTLPDLIFLKNHLIFLELWPFENLSILNLLARFLKTIWARGLKLGQLIEDDEYITWFNVF